MKVYIAAPWSKKTEAKAARELLRGAGFESESSWMDHPDGDYEQHADVMQREAERDLQELQESDALVYLNLGRSEGKATELGYALACGMPVWVVGGKEGNVFLHLSWVEHYESVEAILNELQ